VLPGRIRKNHLAGGSANEEKAMNANRTLSGNNCGSILLAVVLLLCSVGTGWAAESLAVPGITPLTVPDREELLDMEFESPEGAEFGFIDRVGKEELVIDDRLYLFAEDIRYYRSYKGVPVSLSSFQAGHYVGFVLDDDRNIQLIWIAE
jgi:hypothetical protein